MEVLVLVIWWFWAGNGPRSGPGTRYCVPGTRFSTLKSCDTTKQTSDKLWDRIGNWTGNVTSSVTCKFLCVYKQFPGKPAAEVSYKNKLTYRSVHVLYNMRVLQSNARAPDF